MKIVLYKCYKIYAYAIFALTLIPFYPITVLLIRSKKTKKWSTNVFWIWSNLLSILFFIFVKKNQTKLPKGPAIIVANHTSHLDIFLMYQILPHRHIVFMGKSEILSYPLIKTYFKHLHIPVNRNDKRQAAHAMLLAKSKLQEGWSIVIFPEGGIPDNLAPDLAEFKPGAFVMAQKNQVPIIPISMIDHYKLLSEPQNNQGSALPGISHVHIHPYLDSNEIRELDVEYLMRETRLMIRSKLKV